MVVQHIGVGASKILGVRMIFARILSNLSEKLHQKVTYKKKFFMWFWASLSANSAHISRRLLRFKEFVKVFWDFAWISTDLSRIFTKSKLFVCTPAS